jgi:catechol 2,3-dioxygenase-like lactoylglutathione lyase family enzyme
MITPGIDHIALTVPNLDEQVDRLTSAFGMVVEKAASRPSRSSPTPRRD